MANASSNHPLSRRAVAAYGAASAPFEMLKAPGLAILPALYAKQYGFSLTAISMIMLVLRLSDAAMDLGRWLGGRYAIPAAEPGEDDEEHTPEPPGEPRCKP